MPRRLLPLLCAATFLSCSRPLPNLSPLQVTGFPSPVQTQLREAYQKASSHPRDAAANGRLGMVYQAYEQWEAAELAYRRAAALDPKAFDWQYYLGTVLEAQSRNPEAVASLRQALLLKPGHLTTQLRLAESLFRLNEFSESERIYREILSDHAGETEAHFGLARTLNAAGHTQAAIASYEMACTLLPMYGASHYELSAAYRKLGNEQKAKEHLAAFEANKQGAPTRTDDLLSTVAELEESSAALQRRGEKKEDAGDHTGAARLHERAIAVDPRNFWAHGNLVWIYTKLRAYGKAEEQYRVALDIDPRQPRLHLYYGVAQIEQGRYDEAEKALRKALELDPKYADAYFNLGALAERQGRIEEAARRFREAVDHQPENRKARYRLGRLLLELGHEPAAEQQFLALIEPASDESDALQAVANDYRKAGRAVAGLRFARKAQKLAAERRLVSTGKELKRSFPGLDP